MILPSIATLLLCSGGLAADETEAESTEACIEGHVAVRSREMAPENGSKSKSQESDNLKRKGKGKPQEERSLFQRASNLISSSESPSYWPPVT